jgi:hypothetical protein
MKNSSFQLLTSANGQVVVLADDVLEAVAVALDLNKVITFVDPAEMDVVSVVPDSEEVPPTLREWCSLQVIELGRRSATLCTIGDSDVGEFFSTLGTTP